MLCPHVKVSALLSDMVPKDIPGSQRKKGGGGAGAGAGGGVGGATSSLIGSGFWGGADPMDQVRSGRAKRYNSNF